eukprot:TRINITY_DN1025_c0_g1_i1.p1 TRINITY_DN1025_c0_g1~~TRINITY_DN1025_c0_g1_i1.p1  ORF type:complete len:195 (-),score=21.51 TRINITY_DN1025_c0_g1_i1:40-624(-)
MDSSHCQFPPQTLKTIVVRATNDTEGGSENQSLEALLAPPVDYKKIWSGKTMKKPPKFGPVCFWRPIPPPGYVAMGDVVGFDWDKKPNIPDLRCVREDLVDKGMLPGKAELVSWLDKSSGCKDGNLTIWQVDVCFGSDSLPAGTFIALNREGETSWLAPSRDDSPIVYCLKKNVIKTCLGFWSMKNNVALWSFF